ncbi:restriction endonuclease subunit S [Sedimenticola selenatireducens]|uniref:restriction endonuclease subunit S n=1 Tax=Sedimenticola selenatireducens TaxID=191960 RepID=UPI00048A5CB2|nr:restriction endonuclease subunit S [Sedimenticola selenatireducens]
MSYFVNPQKWPEVPLCEIAPLKRGYDLPVKSREEGDVPIYAANGQNGTHNEIKINGPGVITGRSGTIGKVHYVEGGYWPLNTALYVTDFKGNHPKWVYYMLRAFRLERFSEGAGVPTLNRNLVHGELIPLPPLKEQKRIAAILDKADSLRRKRQQAIQLADQFLRSVFLDMFGDPVTNSIGWDEIILKDISDIRSGVTKGKKIDTSTAVTLPYMRVANVQDGYLDLSDIQEITVSPADAEKCKLMEGDILLTEGGDPDKLGRGYVWHGEIDNCIHQNHIFSVRVNDIKRINPLFLSAVIGSQRGKRYFLKVGKQTTGIATINKTVLSEFVPIIPPYALQMRYIKVVNSVRTVKSLQGSTNIGLFDSLSQKAFAGEL